MSNLRQRAGRIILLLCANQLPTGATGRSACRSFALLTLVSALASATSLAIVIDDFTVRPTTVATSGEEFDAVLEVQGGLPTAAVPFGQRVFMAQQADDQVTFVH